MKQPYNEHLLTIPNQTKVKDITTPKANDCISIAQNVHRVPGLFSPLYILECPGCLLTLGYCRMRPRPPISTCSRTFVESPLLDLHVITKAPTVLHGARGYFDPCNSAGTRALVSLARSRGPSQACEESSCLEAAVMWMCIYSPSPLFSTMRVTS